MTNMATLQLPVSLTFGTVGCLIALLPDLVDHLLDLIRRVVDVLLGHALAPFGLAWAGAGQVGRLAPPACSA
jgi:hypothetical protein